MERLSPGGDAVVVDLIRREGEFGVFNIEVDGAHNYFVRGPDFNGPGVLVHNKPMSIARTLDSGRYVTKHGGIRMAERGFGEDAVESIIANNRKTRKSVVDDQGRKTWEYSDKRGNTVVTNEGGDIVTVFSPAEGGGIHRQTSPAIEVIMGTIEGLMAAIHDTISLGRNQGLDVEARYKLPAGWNMESNDEGYVFTGPLSEDAEVAMWSIVRFLSYKDFLVFRRRPAAGASKEYEMLSSTHDGDGFKVLFVLQDVA